MFRDTMEMETKKILYYTVHFRLNAYGFTVLSSHIICRSLQLKSMAMKQVLKLAVNYFCGN